MARTRARLAIGATGRHRSQQSHRRGYRRLALLVRARVLFLTAWQTSQSMAARIHLAASSDRKAFRFSIAVAIARASSGLPTVEFLIAVFVVVMIVVAVFPVAMVTVMFTVFVPFSFFAAIPLTIVPLITVMLVPLAVVSARYGNDELLR